MDEQYPPSQPSAEEARLIAEIDEIDARRSALGAKLLALRGAKIPAPPREQEDMPAVEGAPTAGMSWTDPDECKLALAAASGSEGVAGDAARSAAIWLGPEVFWGAADPGEMGSWLGAAAKGEVASVFWFELRRALLPRLAKVDAALLLVSCDHAFEKPERHLPGVSGAEVEDLNRRRGAFGLPGGARAFHLDLDLPGAIPVFKEPVAPLDVARAAIKGGGVGSALGSRLNVASVSLPTSVKKVWSAQAVGAAKALGASEAAASAQIADALSGADLRARSRRAAGPR